MVIYENLPDDLVKAYSDRDLMIRNIETKEVYCEAIDPAEFNRQYEETDQKIPEVETAEPEQAEKSEQASE